MQNKRQLTELLRLIKPCPATVSNEMEIKELEKIIEGMEDIK